MMSTGAANRRQLLEQGPAFARQIRDALAKNENLAGKPITLEKRLAYAGDVAWAERYFAERGGFSAGGSSRRAANCGTMQKPLFLSEAN